MFMKITKHRIWQGNKENDTQREKDYRVDKYHIGTVLGHFGIGVEVVGRCRLFKWYDDKLCNRANEVTHELRDSKRKLAKENMKLRKQIMKCGNGEMFESGSRNSNVNMSEIVAVYKM
ncbi:hypothetical protein J1N35_022429 [Gossypium stocksii]|uniref:Uncharacterized protein n=1 Tax=Gossypium stocksii TaxID=47602 RepID=A0A9D3VGR3_9ROSI|nr:hypothetical protein J1N35_022429 [Gossypium stocksii]